MKKVSPPLKSTSGAGFSFEDNVAAIFLAEMLRDVPSLGASLGTIQKLERQAIDWEPFGDLLLEFLTNEGELIRCASSIKSNRLINRNGCDLELCDGMWQTMENTAFKVESDFLLLVSTPISPTVRDHVNNLLRQAKGTDAERLDQKIVHENVRKIYKSFHNSKDTTTKGLPGNILTKLIYRECDFEEKVSRSEKEALTLCHDLLLDGRESNRLWQELCTIALGLRLSGGSLTRADLVAKLREKFDLKDDPSDNLAWSKIRAFSRIAMEEIYTFLPGEIELLRNSENTALREKLTNFHGCYVLGDSGFGKSALVKKYANEIQERGSEVVWIKAERWNSLYSDLPNLLDVFARSRRESSLLVIDALEGCPSSEMLVSIANFVTGVESIENSPWSIVLICQTPDWSRVCNSISRHLVGSSLLREEVECGKLDKEDLDLICTASPTVAELIQDPKLEKILSTLKMLDILLSFQHSNSRVIAGEADLVECWWEQQVRGTSRISTEERIACDLACRMANELCSELHPNIVTGAESAANKLILNHVLKRTQDGRLRFEHDLFADWSRVMYLKQLGDNKLQFLKNHSENPPWFRAIRILSQHFLERATDLEQWRAFVHKCKIEDEKNNEPSASNLQIIDLWLEGIIFSFNSRQILIEISADIFANEGWLLKRLIRRLILVGTIPDPMMQKYFEKINPDCDELVSTIYRLPMWKIWSPIIDFLVLYQNKITEIIPVELGKIAEMWARMEDYVKLEWKQFANLIVLNAEKELCREVAGRYNYERNNIILQGSYNERETIYSGALSAAGQLPERVAKLVSKAAGILSWEEGDISEKSKDSWLGKWNEPKGLFSEASGVDNPPQSWNDGPMRKTSSDFSNVWLNSGANAVRVFRNLPDTASKITLGFLLDWPKRTYFSNEYHSWAMSYYGFTFEASQKMSPAFYTNGPFLSFLRENSNPALDLIIKLVNFATERYSDWWPYDNKATLSLIFFTKYGKSSWSGNHQIYAWSRYPMNTIPAVSCSLMALEKWLEEQIDQKKSITHPLQLIYQQGCSLAFAGLLIALGKRHPELFLNELKPLLFVRELYLHDMKMVRGALAKNPWSFKDGNYINNLRKEWENLEGRDKDLNELTCTWFLTKKDFQPVFNEVALAWKTRAENLPEDSEDRLPLLCWAVQFDLENWKEITLPNGVRMLKCVKPDNLRDINAEKEHHTKMDLFNIPYWCNEQLEKRTTLTHERLNEIWELLHDWGDFEKISQQFDGCDELVSPLQDHRHTRAALLAVLFCLGSDWVDKDKTRRPWLEEELIKLLMNPPVFHFYTPDDIHDDGEGFLARCVIQCLANSPNNRDWLRVVGSFITVYRYRTIQRLFEEAFHKRAILGQKFNDIEGLLLSFAVIRQKARIESLDPEHKLINKWKKKWIPKFSKNKGPKWTNDWSDIEIKKTFPPDDIPVPGIGWRKKKRRNFGLNMGVLLAAFEWLPPLTEARNINERNHWFDICKEMLASYIRTLPIEGNGDEEWDNEVWKVDGQILKIVAARLFQCTPEEQRSLWVQILNLPPQAHYHIISFLNYVLIEAIRFEPAKIATLIPMWRSMIEYCLSSPKWTGKLNHKEYKVWMCLFLYAGCASSVKDKDHIPLVTALYDLFERHVKTIGLNSHEQSDFVAFVVSDAGEQLLVNTFEWLGESWKSASNYFWNEVTELGYFETLLRQAWKKYFDDIRQSSEALKAFKILAQNLASQQVLAAVDIQKKIAGE